MGKGTLHIRDTFKSDTEKLIVWKKVKMLNRPGLPKMVGSGEFPKKLG